MPRWLLPVLLRTTEVERHPFDLDTILFKPCPSAPLPCSSLPLWFGSCSMLHHLHLHFLRDANSRCWCLLHICVYAEVESRPFELNTMLFMQGQPSLVLNQAMQLNTFIAFMCSRRGGEPSFRAGHHAVHGLA
jgi:hypothetical protein